MAQILNLQIENWFFGLNFKLIQINHVDGIYTKRLA